MSHFTVSIFTEKKPDETTFERILAPYCEEAKPQFEKFINKTDDVIERWNNGQPIDYSGKVMTDIKGKCKTIDDFASDWFGYKKYGNCYGYMANPNAKWDWWVVGGRWLGELIVKAGVTDFIVGSPGAFNNEAPPEGVDGCRVGDIDLNAMLEAARKNAGIAWDESKRRFDKEGKPDPFFIDVTKITREEYVDQTKAFNTFAAIVDGKWYERGTMGWWACVSNEKDDDEWKAEFSYLLKKQPDNHWVTILDCHI